MGTGSGTEGGQSLPVPVPIFQLIRRRKVCLEKFERLLELQSTLCEGPIDGELNEHLAPLREL